MAKYIDQPASKFTMSNLHRSGQRFKNFPSALYAVDVTFQPTFAPAGGFAEKKRFFSKKHGQYGLKVEASVLPNGLAIHVSPAVPGSVADISICESMEDFHKAQLTKADDDVAMEDGGPLSQEYPRTWAVLADKGYQGLHRHLRAITPAKRPPGGLLSVEEMANNDKIASDRLSIIVVYSNSQRTAIPSTGGLIDLFSFLLRQEVSTIPATSSYGRWSSGIQARESPMSTVWLSTLGDTAYL
ncbi:hypothetical protein H310_13965 [Aphanomyces invadans]|uniref:DDE Tnp4 domain-containing protein n=1 Tax=Aphanomyces invadans TaxID=157072 RepID=A0A024TCX8_9STRA|nr:hypothetical protein H310_13965 [Aphanomyces invadans]ETV91416.1 hypothetical protein H310_13965 [Aphanomyces invadans]|eukprot:XP_008879868.1 hypothetical protein H310_13965 [Aphanomyces invadans]